MPLVDHFSAQPTDVVDAIIALLDDFSCVKTVKRISGDDFSADEIDAKLTSGVPAFLVGHKGGQFEKRGSNSRRFDQIPVVTILCISSYQSSLIDRLASETPTVNPGVEDLLDWATYYGVRAIEGVSGAHAPKPLAHRWVSVEPHRYVAAVDIQYVRRIDCWDDDPSTTLQNLGIVRDPTDEDELFDPTDNVTPQSDNPDDFAGGVYDL